MPSSRAVLADLLKNGFDPKVPHRTLSKKGRIISRMVTAPAEIKPTEVESKLDLVEPLNATRVELPVESTKLSAEPATTAAEPVAKSVAKAVLKKPKASKKDKKEDKPEEPSVS